MPEGGREHERYAKRGEALEDDGEGVVVGTWVAIGLVAAGQVSHHAGHDSGRGEQLVARDHERIEIAEKTNLILNGSASTIASVIAASARLLDVRWARVGAEPAAGATGSCRWR